MGTYADQVSGLKLLGELKSSAGRDGLSQTDVDQLAGMVARVADEVGPLLKRIPDTFTQYTDHDITHCRNVADLMGRFIPPATLGLLNGIELALLLLSALLHDVGMVVADADKKDALRSEELATFCTLHPDSRRAMDAARTAGNDRQAIAIEDALLADYFRVLHPERARKYIRDALAGHLMLGDTDLSDDVCTLGESHGWGVRESRDSRHPDHSVSQLPTKRRVYGLSVNLQYVACCLRLADIMDFDRSRTPVAVFQHIDFTNEKSWREWNKHLQIRGWGIEEREVSYEAECTHPAFYVAVHEFLDAVDAELRECRYLIDDAPKKVAERYLLYLPHIVDRRQVRMKDKRFVAGAFRFQLEYDEIMRLLMDKSLYPDPSLFLRELLQNSLDACRHKEALWKEQRRPGRYRARIEVWDYSDDPEDPRVVFQDNGMGMSLEIIQNYFMRVGKSYYRSPVFEADRERLTQKGIGLEACSCFGIGILSCFLVADRFEVETRREGHTPLRVTVEGPSKYFLIGRLLDEANKALQAETAPGLGAGPPHGVGTRVTVHLRRGTNVNVGTTLATFAVNTDYDVRVHGPGRTRATVIRRYGWRRQTAVTDVPQCLDSGYASGPQPSRSAVKAAQSLQEILTATEIPFDRWDFSRHLSGAAWLWLLKGEDGEPCPARGYLKMGGEGLELVGLPAFIAQAEQLLVPPRRAAGRILKRDVAAELLRPSPHGTADSVAGKLSRRQLSRLALAHSSTVANIQQRLDALDEMRSHLSAKERKAAYRSFIARRDKDRANWLLAEAVPGELLTGSLQWADRAVSFSAAVTSPIGGRIRAAQGIALHGISLPSGLVHWDPAAGRAISLGLLCAPGGLLLDARGPQAPRPSASRLFVEAEQAAAIAVPFARAVLRHAAELAARHPDKVEWREWVLGLIEAHCFGPAAVWWPEALWHEAVRIEDAVGYMAVAGGRRTRASREELVAQFGRYVPVARDGRDGIAYETPHAAGLLFPWSLAGLRTIRKDTDGHSEVDMVGPLRDISGDLAGMSGWDAREQDDYRHSRWFTIR